MLRISHLFSAAPHRFSRRAILADSRLKGFVLVLGFCLVALVWTVLGYHLDRREAALREQTHHDVRNLSIAVEKHVERLLVGVDQVLRFMAEDFSNDPKGFDFEAWLRRSTSLEAVAHQISMYDEAGELLAARTPLAPGLPRFDIRDRDYFRALSARNDIGVYIDRTLKGRLTGRYVLQTARRLSRPDGGFAGVIVISVDPEYLSRQFAALDVGRYGSVAMFGHDGYIRARYPQTEGMYDQNVTTIGGGKGVFAHLKDSPDGTYEVASAFDGVTRVFGYRTVGSLPLVVTVGKSLQEVMAPYGQERDRVLLAGLGFTAFTLAVLLILIRGLEQTRRHASRLAEANQILVEQQEVARTAEAQAREANAILRLAAQIAHVGHWRVELPSNALIWSDEVFRIHGIAESTRPTVEAAVAAYHPDDRPLVARCVDEAIRHGKAFDFSARVVRPDGTLRDIVSRGLCEHGPAGAVTAVFGTFMDVTELRNAERAVGESEALYRLLADNTSDMISHMDLTGRRLFVSPASRDLLGYAPDDLVGTNPQETIHPEDAAGLRSVLADLAAGRRQQAVNVNRLRHRDGRWIWVEASLKRLRGRDGEGAGIIGSIRNVTDRKQAEHALRISEQRYRLLAENTSELIMLGHNDGRRSYISPASQRLLGFSPDELGRMSLRDYVHPDDLARLRATTGRLAEGAAEVTCVYRALHKQAGWISVEGTFRRIPEAQGDDPSIVATFRDVTERERQAQLLEQARAEAEAGGRVKAEFLANMSHELRTPLTGMLGVHDLLRSDPSLSERQVHLIRLAQESGQSLLAIVNDILDFSKIEAGELALEPLPFSLRDLLDGCRQLAVEMVRGKAVTLSIVLPEETTDWLVADVTRLRQILLNLLTNAAKFTSAGEISVRAVYDAAAKRLRVEVADTGIGIAQDKLPILFERFRQADASTSRHYGGTGLGLAICKRLVELMGGEIGVASQPQRGSTFWFDVPLPAAEGSSDAKIAPSLLGSPASHAYRLLVAEDNSVNQEILRSVLEQKGHDVTLVGDGTAAVAALRAGGRFDLVLMDVQMPGLDGIAATRAVRAWEQAERRPPTPIIALTANAMADEIARCRDAGMDAHVAKPIAWGTLFSTMDRFRPVSARDGDTVAGGHRSDDRVLDQHMLDELAEMMGPERMGGIMAAFIVETRRRVALMGHPQGAAEDVAMHAHVLVSLAGQLGFLELSAFCAELEAKTHAGDDLGELRSIAERALSAAAQTPYARAA